MRSADEEWIFLDMDAIDISAFRCRETGMRISRNGDQTMDGDIGRQ